MEQRKGLNDEVNSTTQDRSDAETVRPTPASIDMQALTNSLTMAQRNGRACSVCGSSDYPLVPAGMLGNLALTECDTHAFQRKQDADTPSWLPGPCAPWCEEEHHGRDHPDDRIHWSAWKITPLQTMAYEDTGGPGQPSRHPHSVSLALIQHYREAEARLALVDDMDGKWTLHMTLDEAERVARDLAELIAQARAAST